MRADLELILLKPLLLLYIQKPDRYFKFRHVRESLPLSGGSNGTLVS